MLYLSLSDAQPGEKIIIQPQYWYQQERVLQVGHRTLRRPYPPMQRISHEHCRTCTLHRSLRAWYGWKATTLSTRPTRATMAPCH